MWFNYATSKRTKYKPWWYWGATDINSTSNTTLKPICDLSLHPSTCSITHYPFCRVCFNQHITYNSFQQGNPPNAITAMGVVDSAATNHFLPLSYQGDDKNIQNQGLVVGTANDRMMNSIACDVLKLLQLPLSAQKCHKFVDVYLPLISVDKICQYGFMVTFTYDTVVVTRNTDGCIVLQGTHNSVHNPIDGTVQRMNDSPKKVWLVVPRVSPPPSLGHKKRPSLPAPVPPTTKQSRSFVPRMIWAKMMVPCSQK